MRWAQARKFSNNRNTNTLNGCSLRVDSCSPIEAKGWNEERAILGIALEVELRGIEPLTS